MPTLKLKSTRALTPFKPENSLKNRRKVAAALAACLTEGDRESFLEILSAHVRTTNKVNFARSAKIGRKTLYRVLDKTANPRLNTIMACLQAVY